jgi:hypothetical protein
MKHKSAVEGETIAFSICNKLFKPLGLRSGRVKSREGARNDTHKHFKALCCQQEIISTQTLGSYIMSRFNKMNITIISGHHKSFNSKLEN